MCCLFWRVRSASSHHFLKPSSPDRQVYQEVTDGRQFAKEFAAELAASRFGEVGSSLSPAGHPTGAAAHAPPPITLPTAMAGGSVRPHVSLQDIREKTRAPGHPKQKSMSMDNVGDALTVCSTPSRPLCTAHRSGLYRERVLHVVVNLDVMQGGMAARGGRTEAGSQGSEFDERFSPLNPNPKP
jgi:hypothetical protein